MWIWQQRDWPSFNWQEQKLAPKLRKIRKLEGILQGKSQIFLAQNDPSEQILNALTHNIMASAELEDDVDYQQITPVQIRASLAKRLGTSTSSTQNYDPLAEGLAAIQMEVYKNSMHELGINRLFRWHVNLYSDLSVTAGIRPGAINVGKLRGDEPVQMVSGSIDKPKIHFEAPPKAKLKTEIDQFTNWFKVSQYDESIDPILRAGLAHLWFMTLHPFDDGNSIIARAVTDLALMQSNENSLELYSFSAAMLENKKDYTEMLEYTQRNGLDITHWMLWFVVTLEQAIQTAIDKLEVSAPVISIPDTRVRPAQFQHQNLSYQTHALNKHQVKVLNLMTEGGEEFEKGIGASMYQKLTGVSKATATRHLSDLLAKGCIEKLRAGGRSTRYRVKV